MITCVLCEEGKAVFDHFDPANGIKIYHCLDCDDYFYGTYEKQTTEERKQERLAHKKAIEDYNSLCEQMKERGEIMY